MPAEIANVAVVVGGEVADPIIDLGRGVDEGLRMVRKASERAAVLLRLELFGVRAGFGVVELEGVIGAGEEEQLARVVVVDRGVLEAGCLEELEGEDQRMAISDVKAAGVPWSA